MRLGSRPASSAVGAGRTGSCVGVAQGREDVYIREVEAPTSCSDRGISFSRPAHRAFRKLTRSPRSPRTAGSCHSVPRIGAAYRRAVDWSDSTIGSSHRPRFLPAPRRVSPARRPSISSSIRSRIGAGTSDRPAAARQSRRCAFNSLRTCCRPSLSRISVRVGLSARLTPALPCVRRASSRATPPAERNSSDRTVIRL